jgi:beta-lactamase regulating signal transducer with metallopeptidase domain
MSTPPAQYLPGLSQCAVVDPVAAGSNSSDASYTRTITIVLGIIGAILTLFTLVIATLQYRLQKQRSTDVERDDDGIEMSSQRSATEEGALSTPPP